VARSAANAKLDPDLYVWRLTRDVFRWRYAADLRGPEAEAEARRTTDIMLSQASEGIHSLWYQAQQMVTEVFYHGMADVLMFGGAGHTLDGDEYPARIDVVFRWNLCFTGTPPPADPPGCDHARRTFNAARRWLADGTNRSELEKHLQFAGGAGLWARRDIYAATSWLNQRLIPLARKIFVEKICCLEPPQKESP
jgi:hypothetical protein